MKSLVKYGVSIVLFSIIFFNGCSKKENIYEKYGLITPSENIELTVWESNDGPDEFIREAGYWYNKTHPNVSIKYVPVGIGDSAARAAFLGPQGKGPDLFAAPSDKLMELVNGNCVYPTSFANEIKKELIDTCLMAVTANDGTMYGYPVSAETYALFYNKKLVSGAEVPENWEDLIKWANKFKANHPGKYPIMFDAGNSYYTYIFTTANRNMLFGLNGNDATRTMLNTPDSIKGLKIFQKLRDVIDLPVSELTTPKCDAAFIRGQTALHITGLWNIKEFEKYKLDFGVMALPSFPGETRPATSFSGTRVMFVSKYSKYPDVATDFARFLLTPNMQQLRFNITGALPAINTPVESPYMSGFLKQLDSSIPMPLIPEMGRFWNAMNEASYKIWEGGDIKEIMDECDRQIVGVK